MPGHPVHVGQDYLSELPKLIVAKIRITVIQPSVVQSSEFQNQIDGNSTRRSKTDYSAEYARLPAGRPSKNRIFQ